MVRTQLALIDRSATPAQTTAATDKAKIALERAERVLAQLLVLSRVDAATGAAALQRLDIVAIAKDLTAEMVPLALSHHIDLGYEGATEAMTLAEPVLLAELLKNLLTNAIAYAGVGAVVTVRVQRLGDAVVLEVEDNGPGLSPEQTERAVLRKRGTSAPARALSADQETGFGLGLAITTEIAALFDAEIQLQRGAEQRGLLVRVKFPPLA